MDRSCHSAFAATTQRRAPFARSPAIVGVLAIVYRIAAANACGSVPVVAPLRRMCGQAPGQRHHHYHRRSSPTTAGAAHTFRCFCGLGTMATAT
jgi:hypothetical protein